MATGRNQGGRTYRLVVADSSFLIREGIRQALAGEDEVEVVEYSSDLPSLLRAIDAHHPDVVITAIRLAPTSTDEGVRAAAVLRESHPEVGVVVLSQYLTSQYALRLFEQGSDGRAYLLKQGVKHRIQLMEAIREVAGGRSIIDAKVIDVLVEARSRLRNSPLARLTTREREVLAGIASGKSNAAIAASLSMTKRAVEKHINSIFAKLGLGEDTKISPRVTAALIYSAETATLSD